MDVVYLIRDQIFVWDGRKASENRKKHGIEFEAACQAFFDDYSVYMDATAEGERRSAVIGLSEKGSLLYVVHIERQRDQIRLISAREATTRERRLYEDG